VRISDLVRIVDKVLKIKDFEEGQLVQYEDDGTRAGHVLKIGKEYITIQPIGAKGGKKPHQVKILREYVKTVRKDDIKDQATGTGEV
jgi:hypothetical protein